MKVLQDISGSEYSEPESVSPRSEPTGSVENSSDNGTLNLARKRYGGDNPDNAESSSPKKARKGSQHKSLAPNDSPTDTGAKEPEGLGSVRLRLGGFPVSRSQNPTNVALSVHAPSYFLPNERLATSLIRSRIVQMFLLCQVLLKTCGKQLKDILDIYFRTPLEDKS